MPVLSWGRRTAGGQGALSSAAGAQPATSNECRKRAEIGEKLLSPGATGEFRTRGSSASERLRSMLIWVLTCGMIAWLYVWVATGGAYRFDSSSVPYYDLLADAFLAGQLHLRVEPNPALLALPDPYDPTLNEELRLPDASLFNGRYYLYFGPVPGLIHATWKQLTGSRLEEGAAEVVAALSGCLVFLLLVRRLRRLAFPQLSDAWSSIVALCFALGGVNLHLTATAIGHHEAMLVAVFFMLSGLYFWLRGLEGGRWVLLYFALAGLFLGGAFGSRHTMIGFPLACGGVMLGIWLAKPRDRQAAWQMLMFGILASFAVLLHLTYNHARFGSPFDFGVNYVLTGNLPFNIRSNAFGVLTLNNIGRNLHATLLYAPEFISFFPFQISSSESVGTWILIAPMISIPLVAPLAILAPISVVLLLRRSTGPWKPISLFVLAVASALLIPAAVTLMQVATAARYLHDTVPAALLLGGLVLWWLRDLSTGSVVWRQVVRIIGGTTLVVSATMGVTLAASQMSYEVSDAYVRLAYRFDQLVRGVAVTVDPAAARPAYFEQTRLRPFGPFYTEQEEFELPVVGGLDLYSVQVASGFPEPTRILVDVDGRRVLEDRIFPGQQLLLLDEKVPTGTRETGTVDSVSIRVTFPDQPPRSAGSLQPVSIVADPRGIPKFAAARSYDQLVTQLRNRVEQERRAIEQSRLDVERVRAEVERELASLEATSDLSDPVRSERAQALRRRQAERELALEEATVNLRGDEAYLRMEEEYIRSKVARLAAAAQR